MYSAASFHFLVAPTPSLCVPWEFRYTITPCQNATENNAVFFLSGTSSIENKYETIEKSLSPYKITAKAEKKGPPPAIPSKRHVNVSIRKQLELQHPNAAAASTAAAASSTPTSPLCSTVGQV